MESLVQDHWTEPCRHHRAGIFSHNFLATEMTRLGLGPVGVLRMVVSYLVSPIGRLSFVGS